MQAEFQIGERVIGPGRPTYIIAELSANHGQSLQRAVRIVHAAAEAGADAIKVQTYTADTLTLDCESEPFLIRQGTVWDGRTLHSLYREAYMPWEWQPRLQQVAEQVGLDFFSSPFDQTAVDFLEQLAVPAYKIASFEIVDIPLLMAVAKTGKPTIVSTGMAEQDEIQLAVQTLRNGGCQQIGLLKCTSAYPAPPESMNLKTIADLEQRFGTVAGLSDHTLGTEIPVAAVCLGACIIEKHLTWDRSEGGPDSSFSLEPAEFAQMVSAVRNTEKAIGQIHYGPSSNDRANLNFRRSLFIVNDVAPGERFTPHNVRSIRPGHGIAPRHMAEILGRTASTSISRGTPLMWEHVA